MDWRALEAAVDRATARAFGENVRISFLHGGAVDPTRAAVVTRAVLHVIGADPVRTGPGDTFRSRVATHTAELLLDRSTYAGPIPIRGDKVQAVDRAGQPWFEVASVSDRFTNIIAVSLG